MESEEATKKAYLDERIKNLVEPEVPLANDED
jgi:hypothetical protein